MKVDGYVYMVFNPKSCRNSIKIGRSADKNRARSYGKDSTVFYQFAVSDVTQVEKRIKNAFARFKRAKGFEYFRGDLYQMCAMFIMASEQSIICRDFEGLVVNATPTTSYKHIFATIACQPMHVD